MSPSFYDHSLAELQTLLRKANLSDGQCHELFKVVYHRGLKAVEGNPQLGGPALDYLLQNLNFELPEVVKVQKAEDLTVKFLVRMSDGQEVETVLIPFWKRYTICLSSQVGCAMKCQFCFTGTRGLTRHLKASEILGQYLVAWNWLKEHRDHKVTPNIVFMGQGEPLHNFDQVKKAIELFLSTPGLSLGPGQITLSTVGYTAGLKRFQELPPINLALSLHATTDQVRDELIPLNRTDNLETVLGLLDEIPLQGRKLINYEYLLIKDVNDSKADADRLGVLLKERKAIVNLIPFNEFPGCPYKRPSEEEVEIFKHYLVKHKLRTMVRTTKGDDILAACGQLANS